MGRLGRVSGGEAGTRRVAALVALSAIVLPGARGPLCTAGGHDAGHAADLPTRHAHEPAATHVHDAAATEVRSPAAAHDGPSGGAALSVASTSSAGCHALMACGATLVATEWTEAPTSPHPPLAASPARAGSLFREGPSPRPVLPPPRA